MGSSKPAFSLKTVSEAFSCVTDHSIILFLLLIWGQKDDLSAWLGMDGFGGLPSTRDGLKMLRAWFGIDRFGSLSFVRSFGWTENAQGLVRNGQVRRSFVRGGLKTLRAWFGLGRFGGGSPSVRSLGMG